MYIIADDTKAQITMDLINKAASGRGLMNFQEAVTQPWMRERARSRFDKEGGAEVGGSWAQLRDSTNDIRENAGFPRAHPINRRTGELEDFITKGANQFTHGGLWAAFFMPGNSRKKSLRAKLTTAQSGGPGQNQAWMPDGAGGTKPSPTQTPARPVVGMDAVDAIHLTFALSTYIAGEVAKGM